MTDFANTLPVKAGRGYIAVTFSNGERAVCDRSELPSCPGSFSPLLAYPDPGAISITIATESADGSIRTATYPMTPDSSGGWAYYLDANVRPVTPGGSAGSYNVPLPIRRQRVFTGTILVSPAESPLDIVAEVTLPEAVTAMCSPLRNDRSWEYGRSRYIVCTARAIYTLTVERGARSVTVRRISRRGVDGQDGLVLRQDGGGVLALTGDGILLSITADGRVSELCRRPCLHDA